MRGFVAGSLALTMLYAVLSRREGAQNAGAAFTLATKAIDRLVNPSVPLIPDRRTSS